MSFIEPSRTLRRVIAIDAVVSLAVAILQIAVAGQLGGLLGLPEELVLWTGVFLVGYVMLLGFMARSHQLPRWLVVFVGLGNAGWAAGCVALALGLGVSPTFLGIAYLAGQALVVALFAVEQLVESGRSRRIDSVALA